MAISNERVAQIKAMNDGELTALANSCKQILSADNSSVTQGQRDTANDEMGCVFETASSRGFAINLAQ